LFFPFSVHLPQEIYQRLGPGLVTFFMNEDQFSEDVGEAKGMPAKQLKIGVLGANRRNLSNTPELEVTQTNQRAYLPSRTQ
jgi:hypothetical protein